MIVVRFVEDLLLFGRWFRELVDVHEVSVPFKVFLHSVVRGLECDLVVDDGRKSIAIELKDSDYVKVFQQAMRRYEFFDYVYVGLNLPTSSILSILRSHAEVLERGVGVVSLYSDCVVVPAYSRRKREGRRYVGLLRYITG